MAGKPECAELAPLRAVQGSPGRRQRVRAGRGDDPIERGREGVLPVVAGLAVGIVVALLAARFVEGMLFELSPRDPTVFAAVSALLLGVAVVASLVPARRAARVDPMLALRSE